ncbi:hypothetical protein [Pseudophaeobacter sp. EL27]|uniref:hypothetical protein n=1 Tax=Pseudophaeobacter sp. EL27 TaxID=2107580 RepID=UPI0013C52F2F|nr:hypothetical protein [Pseudophaeobacter sp. EL27]
MEHLLLVPLLLGCLGVLVLLSYAITNYFRLVVWLLKWSLIVQLSALVVCLPVFAILAVLELELGLNRSISEPIFTGVFVVACVLAGLNFYSNKRQGRRAERARKEE